MAPIPIKGHRKIIKAIAFNPKGKLAAANIEGTVKVFNDYHFDSDTSGSGGVHRVRTLFPTPSSYS